MIPDVRRSFNGDFTQPHLLLANIYITLPPSFLLLSYIYPHTASHTPAQRGATLPSRTSRHAASACVGPRRRSHLLATVYLAADTSTTTAYLLHHSLPLFSSSTGTLRLPPTPFHSPARSHISNSRPSTTSYRPLSFPIDLLLNPSTPHQPDTISYDSPSPFPTLPAFVIVLHYTLSSSIIAPRPSISPPTSDQPQGE
jgi:hypothetical protein